MPLTDGGAVTLAAGATVDAFTGHPIEFIGSASVARLLLTADAAGVIAQWVVNVGGNQMVPLAANQSVNVASVAGAGPKDDEDTVVNQQPIPAGARSSLLLTNTGAASTVARWRAYLLP